LKVKQKEFPPATRLSPFLHNQAHQQRSGALRKNPVSGARFPVASQRSFRHQRTLAAAALSRHSHVDVCSLAGKPFGIWRAPHSPNAPAARDSEYGGVLSRWRTHSASACERSLVAQW